MTLGAGPSCRAGFTIVEMLCGVAILSALAIGISSMINKYLQIQRIASRTEFEQRAERALIPLVADLKEADATAFDWFSLPNRAVTLSRVDVDKTTGLAGTTTNILYDVEPEPGSLTRGALVRRKNGVTTVLLRPVEVSSSVFSRDPAGAVRVMIFSVNYIPDNMPPIPLIRRLTLRG